MTSQILQFFKEGRDLKNSCFRIKVGLTKTLFNSYSIGSLFPCNLSLLRIIKQDDTLTFNLGKWSVRELVAHGGLIPENNMVAYKGCWSMRFGSSWRFNTE